MSRDRQQEKARRSRERLLEAAGKLLSEKNIADVGVREIASEAGCTTGTFYHYFTRKDDIIHHLYEGHDAEMGEIQTFFAQNLSGAGLMDGWEFTCHRVFQVRRHSGDENQLYMGMQELIQKAIEAGELQNKVPAKEINEYLFVVFRGILYEWCICSPENLFPLSERLEKMIGYALRSFQNE